MHIHSIRHRSHAFRLQSLLWLSLLCGIGTGQAKYAQAISDEDFFEKRIRPILVERCQQCHSSTSGKTHGGLALDSQQGWRQGGDSGPAIVPGQLAESLLIQAVRYEEDGPQMPPDSAGGKLPDAEIELLAQWVSRGAFDPRVNAPLRGGLSEDQIRNWWSFQPLHTSPLDHPTGPAGIDHLIETKLHNAGLRLSSEADRRTLIRRVTYDLTGLPPTPQEVEHFIADQSPTAYETVLERLLASPHYGERWGKHWLDLVRYADTAGENSDHPLPHAWRYRNWVIDAFNQDLPYDVFLRHQMAGDLLVQQTPCGGSISDTAYADGIIATGFLALARRFDHDADKFMHLTHEDGIDTIGKAFQGLTLGCARCHDHKYDAVTARDYYALYGILESTKFSFPGCEAKQQPRDLVPLTPPDDWENIVKPYQDQVAANEAEIASLIEQRIALAQALQAKLAESRMLLSEGQVDEGGQQAFQSEPAGVEVKAGQLIMLSITPLGNHGADSTRLELVIDEIGGTNKQWNAASDLIPNLLVANPHTDSHGNSQTWWLFDTRNQPLLLPEAISALSGAVGIDAWRNGETPSVFVNKHTTAINLWTPLTPQSLFVHPAPDGNVAIGWLSPITGTIRVTGSVEDAHPGGPNGVGWVLERFATDAGPLLAQQAATLPRQTKLTGELAELRANAPTQDVAFAVAEGTPADARLHLQGDPEKLGPAVPRRWLEIFGGTPISNHQQSGRLDLADWIASPENPLTARVMVNRIWLHHFGKGIVDTPNDFGTRGQPPTHPALLDWLANQFIESGWSIKQMHRLIMLSKTYRQSSVPNSDALAIDVTNDLVWRFDRRRLSAEELRDSLLLVGQQLDRSRGNSHQIPPEESWSYTQHIPFVGVPETNLRSIYQIVVRNRRPPFQMLFDGADPNASTPQRQVTTVPTQSLYFMNDPFFHQQSMNLAARVIERPQFEERLDWLYRLTLQRFPDDQEREQASQFVKTYAVAIENGATNKQQEEVWAALARVLLASNEFLYLD
ncbi:PSD1 and planctomycete cytochrome C domain-containing protein [Planctomycetaceae bacterium SH139]